MNSEVWGPPFWFALHSVTFNYPIEPDIEQKERIRNFFNSLEYILPCQICRVHYSHHIRKHPIENKLSTRKDLVYWLIDIHNLVNIMNGKPALSYDKVVKMYEKAYGKKIQFSQNEKECQVNSEEPAQNVKREGKKVNVISKQSLSIIVSLSIISAILLILCIYFLLRKRK